MATATAPTPTGMDLRLERVRRRATVTAVALAAGLSRQRITAIEATAWPTAQAATRYLAALDSVEVSRRRCKITRRRPARR